MQEPSEPDIPHCFIVRLDARLNARVEAHRKELARRRGRRVSLADAARDLFHKALGPTPKRLNPTPSQLGLFQKRE